MNGEWLLNNIPGSISYFQSSINITDPNTGNEMLMMNMTRNSFPINYDNYSKTYKSNEIYLSKVNGADYSFKWFTIKLNISLYKN